MGNLLQQLENNEAILLMYLSDELAPEDRAEVQQMLSRDASMAAELERMRSAHQLVQSAFAEMDVDAPLPVSEPTARRQISRLVRQRQVEQLKTEPVAEAPRRKLRIPWWISSSSIAAAAVVAVIVWWGLKPERPESPQAQAPDPEVQIDLAERTFDTSSTIADAEQQASALATESSGPALAASVFMNDQNQQ